MAIVFKTHNTPMGTIHRVTWTRGKKVGYLVEARRTRRTGAQRFRSQVFAPDGKMIREIRSDHLRGLSGALYKGILVVCDTVGDYIPGWIKSQISK